MVERQRIRTCASSSGRCRPVPRAKATSLRQFFSMFDTSARPGANRERRFDRCRRTQRASQKARLVGARDPGSTTQYSRNAWLVDADSIGVSLVSRAGAFAGNGLHPRRGAVRDWSARLMVGSGCSGSFVVQEFAMADAPRVRDANNQAATLPCGMAPFRLPVGRTH